MTDWIDEPVDNEYSYPEEDDLLSFFPNVVDEELTLMSPIRIQTTPTDNDHQYNMVAFNSLYNTVKNDRNFNLEMLDENTLWQTIPIFHEEESSDKVEMMSEMLEDHKFVTTNGSLFDTNESADVEDDSLESQVQTELPDTADIDNAAVWKLSLNETNAVHILGDIIPKDYWSDNLCKSTLPFINAPNNAYMNEKNENVKMKTKVTKKKSKKNEGLSAATNVKVKLDEQEDCVDVETVPRGEQPVIEAGDVNSLLEQFEASENPKPCGKSTVKNNGTYQTKVKSCRITQKCRTGVLKKSVSQTSTHQKPPASLSKDVINKIKASGQKKTIPIIPAMPNIQGGNCTNGTRTQNGALRNKKSSTTTNSTKSNTFNNFLIHLDHDYCAKVHTKNGNNNRSKTVKRASVLKPKQNNNGNNVKEHVNNIISTMCNSKSAKVCDINRKPCKPIVLQDKTEDSIKSLSSENINSNKSKFIDTMTINSVLAKKILQTNGVLPKMKMTQVNSKTQHMISVLKKPPNATPSPTDNSNENVVTTANNLSNETQSVIVQNTQDSPCEEVKRNPPRKKVGLSEYLKRNKNKIISKKLSLVYAYHATTQTELCRTELTTDESESPNIWCDREVLANLEVKDEKKPKPVTCDAEVQTLETMFECSSIIVVDVEKESEEREKNIKNEEQNSCKRVDHSSSRPISRNKTRSRSRSSNNSDSRNKGRSGGYRRRSRSRSLSRTRSRNRNRRYTTRSRSISRSISRSRSNSRNSSRSRSRRRSNTRRRTISHRRSVSSTSSTSSSRLKSSASSRSRYSRSRSRSHYRSRSRSRSRSRFYSQSGSSSRSSSKSGSRSSRQYSSSHSRAPLHSYPYDNWYNRQKQREIEERRVIYVGRIDEGITKAELRERFQKFGPIVDISIHLRERGDNYGFVTFLHNTDAYTAIERGNDNPSLPKYDLCFGGRRTFCKSKYSDLDDIRSAPYAVSRANEEDFDYLLREAIKRQSHLHRQKV
ncbi:hypothetical protein PUN28_001026 [Cardiocondyla obscurior]|uniref:RRM domain-containing protein n=1 Tax=Cardiocondyla obscurior TaxID=286306 RepID=A0AAW2H2H9_9HYME